MEKIKHLIIGGGVGGLGLAAYLSKKFQDITLFEAHYHLGGCASFYSCSGYTFDVGATTICGLSPHLPIAVFEKETGIKFDAIKIDPGISFHLNDKVINKYSCPTKWEAELNKLDLNNGAINSWKRAEAISKEVYKMLSKTSGFPPKSLSDWAVFTKPSFLKNLGLVKYLFTDIFTSLPEFEKNAELKKLIKELYRITLQSEPNEVPLLLGTLAMSYPNDVWYHKGGMKGMIETLEKGIKPKVKIKKSCLVTDIQPKDGYYICKTTKGDFIAENLYLNMPIWNAKKFPGIANLIDCKEELQNKESAIALYGSIKLKQPMESLYHQVHMTDNLPYATSGSYFISLSHPMDFRRAPKGEQTFTISYHTKTLLSELSRDESEYLRIKSEIFQFFTKEIMRFFGDNLLNLDIAAVATPKTFERYTQRRHGQVGGIPHTFKNNIFKFPSSQTSLKNLYFIGDTTFPGQGIMGILTSARFLSQSL